MLSYTRGYTHISLCTSPSQHLYFTQKCTSPALSEHTHAGEWTWTHMCVWEGTGVLILAAVVSRDFLKGMPCFHQKSLGVAHFFPPSCLPTWGTFPSSVSNVLPSTKVPDCPDPFSFLRFPTTPLCTSCAAVTLYLALPVYFSHYPTNFLRIWAFLIHISPSASYMNLYIKYYMWT